jgi:hypothetical protein
MLNLHTAPADISLKALELAVGRIQPKPTPSGRLIFANCQPANNRFGKGRAALNLTFMAIAASCVLKRRLAYQCLFSNILPSWDQHFSSLYLLRMLTLATTRAIRASTDRYLKARFTHLG